MSLRPVHLLLLAVCFLLGALTACISVPEGYEDWKQVNREYESADYITTLNYLDDLLRTDNTYTARAAALKVVILGGMTRSALEIEEACAEGIHWVKAADTGLYKACVDRFRWRARTSVLDLIDALAEFDNSAAASDTVSLDFPLPEASAQPSPMIGQTEAGVMPGEKIFEPSAARILDRQILLQVCDVANGEVAAVKEMFESTPVTIPKETFLVGVAKTLLAAAAVFGEDRLDDTAKRSATLKRAQQCLQPALDGADETLQSEAKALAQRIRAESRR